MILPFREVLVLDLYIPNFVSLCIFGILTMNILWTLEPYVTRLPLVRISYYECSFIIYGNTKKEVTRRAAGKPQNLPQGPRTKQRPAPPCAAPAI